MCLTTANNSLIRTPPILWPTLVWVLIGTETLAILWFHVSFVPVELSLDGYLWECATLFGSSGQFIGVVPAMQMVNILAALALWIAFRSARRFDRSLVRATLAASLLGAFVLASIGWWGVRTQDRCRPLEIRAVHELGASGEYNVRELPAR